MAKWVCPVCGYVHTGDTPPEKCPLCGVPGAKFLKALCTNLEHFNQLLAK
jgi:rubrerythrin